MSFPSTNTAQSCQGESNTLLLAQQMGDEVRDNAFYGLHLLADVCSMTNLEELLQQLELKVKGHDIQHTNECRRDGETTERYVLWENGEGSARPNNPKEILPLNDFGPVKVMKKKMTTSDMNPQQMRLIIPKEIVKKIFSKMTWKEIHHVEEEPSGFPITVRDLNDPSITFHLKFSCWKSSNAHIFNGAEWKSLCNRYQFVPKKDFLILYMYRMNGTLGFLIEIEKGVE